ncbi:VWA domain-containing protein [bacterium]|nr:VWA domain-containing protein [bacterium]
MWSKTFWIAVCLGMVWTNSLAQTVDPRLRHNLYIIFDGSGSMDDEECSAPYTKIEVAKKALITFLDTIPADYNLGLYVFDHHGQRELFALGQLERGSLFDKISAIRAGGSTPLCSSIEFASTKLLEQKEKQLGYGHYMLLIVTDGRANREAELPASLQPVIEQGIIIQVIGFCLSQSHSLQKMVHAYRDANSAQELVTALSEVLGEADRFVDFGDWREFEQLIESGEQVAARNSKTLAQQDSQSYPILISVSILILTGLVLILLLSRRHSPGNRSREE